MDLLHCQKAADGDLKFAPRFRLMNGRPRVSSGQVYVYRRSGRVRIFLTFPTQIRCRNCFPSSRRRRVHHNQLFPSDVHTEARAERARVSRDVFTVGRGDKTNRILSVDSISCRVVLRKGLSVRRTTTLRHRQSFIMRDVTK